MPANLNALLRYKTINGCLYGGRRKWSIDELIDACSDALAESRGRYDAVSERTIRDDIRVMRSDILGFNAPIDQNKGLYFYSDPGYSILSVSINDSGLATQIINLLLEIKMTVNHPELENILERLRNMTGMKDEPQVVQDRKKSYKESASFEAGIPAPAKVRAVEGDAAMSKLRFRISGIEVEWGDILSVVSSFKI
jgi:hypothetical protein